MMSWTQTGVVGLVAFMVFLGSTQGKMNPGQCESQVSATPSKPITVPMQGGRTSLLAYTTTSPSTGLSFEIHGRSGTLARIILKNQQEKLNTIEVDQIPSSPTVKFTNIGYPLASPQWMMITYSESLLRLSLRKMDLEEWSRFFITGVRGKPDLTLNVIPLDGKYTMNINCEHPGTTTGAAEQTEKQLPASLPCPLAYNDKITLQLVGAPWSQGDRSFVVFKLLRDGNAVNQLTITSEKGKIWNGKRYLPNNSPQHFAFHHSGSEVNISVLNPASDTWENVTSLIISASYTEKPLTITFESEDVYMVKMKCSTKELQDTSLIYLLVIIPIAILLLAVVALFIYRRKKTREVGEQAVEEEEMVAVEKNRD